MKLHTRHVLIAIGIGVLLLLIARWALGLVDR
jgi:hypothetical protein